MAFSIGFCRCEVMHTSGSRTLPPLLTFGTIQPCVELLPSVGDSPGTLGGRNPENEQVKLVLSDCPCVDDKPCIDIACFCTAYHSRLKHSISLKVTVQNIRLLFCESSAWLQLICTILLAATITGSNTSISAASQQQRAS